MAHHIKLTLIFDAGKEVEMPDMDALTDGVIDLLTKQFPEHSGTFMSGMLVNENGDPVKK